MAFKIGIDARKLTDFGIGTYIGQLLRGLAEIDQQNDYVVFTGMKHKHELLDLPPNFLILPERSPVYSVRELFVLSWRIFRLKLDLYHATHYVLPGIVPCRAVVTIHDIIHLLYPEFLPNPLAFVYAQTMIKRSLVRGDRIIADSQNTKTDLMNYFDVRGRKIRVVYPGVSGNFRRQISEDDRKSALKKLGVDRKYLLFVGNPKPHKNLDNVVKAYARALEIGDFEADLVCVGDREGAAFKIRQRAEQLGVGGRIRLLGYVDEEVLPAIYQGALGFIYPTLYEGFGLPVVEAMASGVPVITSGTSALKEVAEGYADLVDPLDVEALAKSIHRLVNDDEHRLSLAKLGLKRSADFDWTRTAEQTLKVYMSALGQPDPGGDPTRTQPIRTRKGRKGKK